MALQLACTAQLVRERRIGQMGSMDSLLELAPGAVPEAEVPTPQQKLKQQQAQQKPSGRLGGGLRSRSADTAAAAGAPGGVPGSETMRALSGGASASGGGTAAGDGDADAADPAVGPQAAALAAMRLTPDQQKLLLTVRGGAP